MNAIVISARQFAFKDDQGRNVEGVTLTYADPAEEATGGRKGLTLMNATAPAVVWDSVQQVPGYYDLDFRMRPGKGGRPVVQLVGADFKAAVHFGVSTPEAGEPAGAMGGRP